MPNEKPILLCVERTLKPILNLRQQFLKRKKGKKREKKRET